MSQARDNINMNFSNMLLFRRYKMMYIMIIINNHSYKL